MSKTFCDNTAAPVTTGGKEFTIAPVTAAPVKIGAIEPEFFRLPTRGTDPYFGLTRPWYYIAIGQGLIKSVSLRRPGTSKGVRLIHFQSVRDYLRSKMEVS